MNPTPLNHKMHPGYDAFDGVATMPMAGVADTPVPVTGGKPASSSLLKLKAGAAAVGLDTLVIEQHAQNPMSDSEHHIADYHRRRYTERTDGESKSLEAKQREVAERLQRGRAELRTEGIKCARTDRYLTVDAPEGTKPLTSWVVLVVTLLFLTAAVMLVGDMQIIASTYVQSGLAIYAVEPWRAWFASSAPLVLAIATEALIFRIKRPSLKHAATVTVGVAGTLCALAWVYLFALTHEEMTRTGLELLGGLQDAAPDAKPHSLELWKLLAQVLGGAFGSVAVVGCGLAILAGRHGKTRLPNPEFAKAKERIGRLEETVEADSAVLGLTESRLSAIEAGEQTYVGRAIAAYRATLAARHTARG